MTVQEIVVKNASEFGLDPALVCAVCEQESNWNQWAERYEDGFYHKYIHPPNECKPTTEQLNEAQSFGLMQVMGGTARELGFKGKFLTELCDPDTGTYFGCKKLRKCMDAHNGDVHAALLAYNGGSNKAYPNEVLARVDKYVK